MLLLTWNWVHSSWWKLVEKHSFKAWDERKLPCFVHPWYHLVQAPFLPLLKCKLVYSQNDSEIHTARVSITRYEWFSPPSTEQPLPSWFAFVVTMLCVCVCVILWEGLGLVKQLQTVWSQNKGSCHSNCDRQKCHTAPWLDEKRFLGSAASCLCVATLLWIFDQKALECLKSM